MSTILKALRRLEQEREARAVALRDQVVAHPRPADPRPRLPLVIAAGAAGAVVVVAAFVWMDGRTPAPIAVADPPPAATPAPIAVAEVAPPPAAFAPEPVPVAPLPAPSPAPAVSAPPPPAPVAEPKEMPGIVGQPEVARRSPLPRIVVERTLWHPASERRLAFLHVEGREGIVELREGDAVGDAVVQQIDPSAVLFVYNGVEIRRRIGAD